MRITTEAKMEAGGTVRNFYITDNIAADDKRYNWHEDTVEIIESKTSQRYFVDNLQGLTAADRVNLYINSMGGSVKEALGIYSALQRCPATISAYIDGFAASAASVIAMAAERVVMPRNTAMMIHNAAWWAYGNPAELRKSADDLEVINMAAIQSYAMHAGDKLPQEELQRLLDAETWLTAEDCIRYGLADEYGEEDVKIDTAAQQFATAKAQAGPKDGFLFANPPAFLNPDGGRPEQPKPQNTNHQGEPGKNPDNHSGIAKMLKSLIHTEENT